MYRNTFYYQGVELGSSLSDQDDVFKALREGETKAETIARALRVQIPGVKASEVEIHCMYYDPQYWLRDSEGHTLVPIKAPDVMHRLPNANTLRSLNVSTPPTK